MATYRVYVRQYKEYMVDVEIDEEDDPGYIVVNDIIGELMDPEEDLTEQGWDRTPNEGVELVDYEILED